MKEYRYSMRDKRDKNSISGKTQQGNHCEIFHMQHPPQRLKVEGFFSPLQPGFRSEALGK